MVKGSEKVTRELTRALIKFVNEKKLSNKTTVNHINRKGSLHIVFKVEVGIRVSLL